MLTLDECLDRLAELDGWRFIPDSRWFRKSDGHFLADGEHPIPPTRDAVAALWPVGWGILITKRVGLPEWFASASPPRFIKGRIPSADAATEIHARARLTVAVLEHLAKEKSDANPA